MITSWETIFIMVIGFIGFFSGIIVYFKAPKKKVNQIFTFFTLSVLIWILGAFFSEIPKNLKFSLILSRITYLGVLLAATFLFYFSFYFPKETILEKKWKYLTAGITIIFFLLTFFSNLVIKGIILQSWGFNLEFGNLYYPFIVYCIFLVIVAIRKFLKNFKISSPLERLQLRYLLLGIIIFVAASIIVNVIIRAVIGSDIYYRFGNYSAIFLVVFTAFAITRYHLFEIRLILTEILVGAIGIILLIQVITAETLGRRIFSSIILILFSIFGYLLIKTTLEEIRRRQEIEKLSEQIKISNIRLESALKALEKLDKAKTEFLSIASHQLRTPLTAIKGYLSMIQEGIYGKFPKEFNEILNKIYLSNTRLIDLVNSLLDISRIEMGRMEFKFEEIQIGKIIESIIEELSIQAKQKNLYLKFEKPKRPLPKIRADESKIRQVILNLIDNAIRYTEKGGVTIKVKNLISAIQISVRDTGIGLTPKEVESLFGMYARGKGMSIFPEGAGLGLYVARKLLEAHLGRIWAESAGKNKGSTFYVDLPVR